MSHYDVIIAGGGVGGLATALALATTHRLKVLVVERRSGPGNINRGDSLLPSVVAHLTRWNARHCLLAAGAKKVSVLEVYHHRAGLLMSTPLPEHSQAPYLVLPHPEIERALTEAARATGLVDVRYLCRVTGLLQNEGRISGVTLSDQGETSSQVHARLVIGADGASSVVRSALGVPLVKVPYDHDYFVVDLDRPTGYRDAMRIELHPDGGALIVPGIDRVGVALLVRPQHESLFRSGTLEDKLAEVTRRVPLLRGCNAAQGAHLYKLSRGHAPSYVARGAALLGDAVHVTNPTAGQGMTMAIEDAAALCEHVGGALGRGKSGADLDVALVRYERARRPKNAERLRWSHWMSRLYALKGESGDQLRRGVFTLGGSRPGRLLLDFIWSRMATRGVA